MLDGDLEPKSSTSILSTIRTAAKSKVMVKSAADGTTLPKKVSSKKGSGDGGYTILPCGEKVHKSSKIFSATGVLEELIGSIGLLKSLHFNIESSSARKMFIYARLTKIQEDLQAIIKSVLVTPKVPAKFTNSRFDDGKIVELSDAISAMNSTPFIGLPGSTKLESDIYLTWTLCRRAERQLLGIRDTKIGIILEESVACYMNRLGDYFNHLINHTR